MIRKYQWSYSRDQKLHEFWKYLWIKGNNCCLHQCVRGWWFSLLSGIWILLTCCLLHVCAQLRRLDKERCGFCWTHLVFDMILGEKNGKWPFTTWNKEKKQTPSCFLRAQALLLIEPNLLHAEYMDLVSIWLRKCSKLWFHRSTYGCVYLHLENFQGSRKSVPGILNGSGGGVLKIWSNS